MKVALFITCLTDSYFPRAGIAVVKVLEHLGHTVEFPQQQTCCGQPMFNNGFRDDARDLALRMIDVFEPYETVVTPSGSCAAMIREHYAHLFEGDSHEAARAASLAKRTFEFSEFLANVLHVDLRELGVKWEGDVTAHSACHLRGLGLTGVAEGLLGGVSGLNLVPLGKVEQCCGFGGTFSVKMPEISGGMVAEKVASIKATGCRTVVCNEAGCGMNIAGACRRTGVGAGFTSLAEIIAEGLGLMHAPGARLMSGHPAEAPVDERAPQGHGGDVLSPPLPYDMRPAAAKALRDVTLQQFVNHATNLKDRARVSAFRAAFGDKAEAVRSLAGGIKQHTLDHLDHYLDQFIDAAESSGAKVHFAAGADEANAICLAIAKANSCKLCVKSKSMVTEETRLVPTLEAIGIETLETDLGEFIIQLDHDAPSHIVSPMIHKNRASVARAFVRELGAQYTEDPPTLTAIARQYMRKKFRSADLGISGANFLIAETGSLVICTNEGNADLSVGVPRVHVAMVGIEKLVPRLEDLSVFLKLLARSATAQPLTVYSSIITGPRKKGEADGPDEVHIILLDNGRTEILREETRELLRCIRCGACLNACPVYRKIGGHAYGAVYSGPIGATITPLLKGLENYPDLPHASSLCGACFEACPVKIDIPSQLIRLRTDMVDRHLTSFGERAAMKLWSEVLKHPWVYRMAASASRAVQRSMGEETKTTDPYSDRKWITSGPGPVSGWTSVRDLPTPTSQSFRDWWAARPDDAGRTGI